MFTIALVNQKGGVGKSTTAVNLSAGLSRLGKKVLLIDLDPQAHSTVSMGLQPKKLRASVYTVLAGLTRTRDAILPVTETLSILPATIDLAAGEAELASQPNAQFILKNAMASVDGAYDYVIVDSPPQLGFLNINSLAWVKEVFIPVTCEFYALHGLSLLMETVERVKAKLNPDLKISGVIPCQFNPRRALTRDVLADLERHFPGRVTKAKIRVNVRLAEAPSHGMNIFDYAPESNGAKDYGALAQEMIERSPNAELPPLLQETEAPVAEAAAAEVVIESPKAAPVVEPAVDVIVAAPVAEVVVETAKADPIPVIVEPAVEPEPVVVTVDAPPPGAEVEPEPQTEAVVCVAVEAPLAHAVAEAPAPEIPFTPPTMGRVEEPTVMNLPTPAVYEAPAPEPEYSPEPIVMIDASAYVEPEAPVAPVRAAVAPAPAPAPAAPARASLGTTPMATKFGGMNGLKPIVTHRPGFAPPVQPKKGISGFFGKLLNRNG